ncbi:hypothetical protein [Nocardia sp. NPDC005366]
MAAIGGHHRFGEAGIAALDRVRATPDTLSMGTRDLLGLNLTDIRTLLA